MIKCDCYNKDHSCNGTREKDHCYCGGNKSKCDFYEDVRKEASLQLNTLKLPYVHCINKKYNNQFRIIYKDKNGELHITHIMEEKEIEKFLEKMGDYNG